MSTLEYFIAFHLFAPHNRSWYYQENNSVLASSFFLRIKIHTISRIEEMACAVERSFLLHSMLLAVNPGSYDLSMDLLTSYLLP